MRLAALLSRVICCLALTLAAQAKAHEVQPAISDITVFEDRVDLAIALALEAPLAGIDLDGLTDTNEAENGSEYDRLRTLPPAELEAALRAAWPNLRQLITLRAGETALTTELRQIDIPAVGNPALSRTAVIWLEATLPDDGSPVVFGWAASLGALVVRQQGVADGYTGFLTGGALSPPLPRDASETRQLRETTLIYLVAGVVHILPQGIDHILFVLALFFFVLGWGPVFWQVAAFALGHAVVLGLAGLGVFAVPLGSLWLVEALVALSITYVAAENLLRPKFGWLRPVTVFAFGVLHGLTFAGVLVDFGLPQGQVAPAVIGFAVGIELALLAVILAAFLAVILARAFADVAQLGDEEALVRDLPVLYRAVSLVVSFVVACLGAYWFFARLGVVH